VIALDGVYPFELSIPHRVFSSAGGRYEVVTCSVDGRPVPTNADFAISVQHGPDALAAADTVVVPPSTTAAQLVDSAPPAAVLNSLARIAPGTRLVSICTASFVLGAAGLLDGRSATTHWCEAESFRRSFPRVRFELGALFVDDGDVLTSAGAASGIDLCLYLIRKDHGTDVANGVARACVVPPWRDGGQAQFIEQPIPASPDTSTASTRDWALSELHRSLSLAVLAKHAQMSVRTFVRRFNDEVGLSPGRWLIQQRVNRAQQLLESTDLPVDRISQEVGFSTAASLRQHFQATIGVSPVAYRRTFRVAEPV
jgi:transcriptional regulator GlxA family with amidase domain